MCVSGIWFVSLAFTLTNMHFGCCFEDRFYCDTALHLFLNFLTCQDRLRIFVFFHSSFVWACSVSHLIKMYIKHCQRVDAYLCRILEIYFCAFSRVRRHRCVQRVERQTLMLFLTLSEKPRSSFIFPLWTMFPACSMLDIGKSLLYCFVCCILLPYWDSTWLLNFLVKLLHPWEKHNIVVLQLIF